MDGLIPEEWRRAVVAILRNSTRGGRVEIVARARRDWESAFPLAFNYELYDALARTLCEAVEGREVHGMTPPCVAYEFFFFHQAKRMYGKVGLHDACVVIVFSAHTPLKGNAL